MTNETITRPEIVEDEHLEYLDDLRESGIESFGRVRRVVLLDEDLQRTA